VTAEETVEQVAGAPRRRERGAENEERVQPGPGDEDRHEPRDHDGDQHRDEVPGVHHAQSDAGILGVAKHEWSHRLAGLAEAK